MNEHELTLSNLEYIKLVSATKLSLIKKELVSHASLTKKDFIDKFDNTIFIHDLLNLKVSSQNLMRDDEWDFNTDVLNPARSVQGAKLKIDFARYKTIPEFIILELKCLFHFIRLTPGSFTKQNKIKKLKENTLISQFEAGLRFLNQLFLSLMKNGRDFVKSTFVSILDITETDFKKLAETSPALLTRELFQFLKYLVHPSSQDVLGKGVRLNFNNWAWKQKANKSRKSSMVLPNEVFSKLIHFSTYQVLNFLQSMEETIEDGYALKYFDQMPDYKKIRPEITISKELFNDYGIIRLLAKGHDEFSIHSTFNPNKKYLDEKGKYKRHEYIRIKYKSEFDIQDLNSLRVQINLIYYAAAYIIAQYTGMRPSELSEISLSNCLKNEDNLTLIASRVIKTKKYGFSLFDDRWVAIPIMKDAIRTMQLISKLKANDYAFSSMDTVNASRNAMSLSGTGLKEFFLNYFNNVLGENVTEQLDFTPYMIRHTLAYQLHRAELGLPFISYQLKHLINSISAYTSMGATSEVSLGYGEIAEKIILQNAQNHKIRHIAEIEKVSAVMDPDGTYIGAKGKEHKVKLIRIFEGYMAAGYSKEEILEEMVDQGLAIISVGSGFCYGGTEDFDDSIPCIGTLRCNPYRCKDAVISQANIPKWKEILTTNETLLHSPGYESRKDQILETIEEAKKVLDLLEGKL